MRRSLKKRIRLDRLFAADTFFSTDRSTDRFVEGTFSNLAPDPITYESILANMRAAMATFNPPGYMTRDSLFSLVTERLSAHGYRDAYLVFGERNPGHVVVQALARIPPSVRRVVREEIQDHAPAALMIDIVAMGYCEKHDDCRDLEEMAAACWRSTH